MCIPPPLIEDGCTLHIISMEKIPIYTEYRIVQECFYPEFGTRPILYVFQTKYTDHDEAIAAVHRNLQTAISIRQNEPDRPPYEFIGDEYVTELFYRNSDGEKVIDTRYRICPIEAFEHLTDDKRPRYYNSYKYRGYDISENAQGNRFSVVINGHKTIKHKLNTLFDFIDGCILEMES